MPLFKIPKQPQAHGPRSIRDSVLSILTSSSKLTPQDEINIELTAGKINQQNMLVEKMRQEAALLAQQRERGERRGDDLQTAAAAMAGVDLPQFQDFAQYRRTGQMPSLSGESAEVGPIQPKYQWSRDDMSAMDRAIAAATLGGQMKDINPQQVAASAGSIQGQQMIQNVLDEIRAGDYTKASAISQASRPGNSITLYKPIGTTGAMESPTTGAVTTDNALAAAEIERRVAQGDAARTRANAGGAAGQRAPVGYRFSSDGETLEPIPGGPKAGGSKPLPTQALKMQQAELDAIGLAAGISSDLAAIDKQIESGALDLGMVSNFINQGRNIVGLSNKQSKNLASFKATLEKLRNDSLRLNKGVQTEGDAIRAWNEMISSINDPGVVRQRLAEIQEINNRAVDLRKMSVDQIRENYGADPIDVSGYTNQRPAVGQGGASGGWDGKERRRSAPQSAPKEGDTGTSKSGRPIVFRGGAWEYADQGQ